MKKTNALIVLGVVMLAISGVAAAASSAPLQNQTETVGIVGSEENLSMNAAMAGPTDATMTGTQTIYVGGEQISRTGAAATLRVATEQEEDNLTLVGQQTDVAFTYFTGLETKSGNSVYPYVDADIESDSPTELSEQFVSQHWDETDGVVVANSQRVLDYAGGSQYARANGMPLLYGTDSSDFESLNDTLSEMNVSNVYVTSNVGSSFTTDANETYTVTELGTESGNSFINNEVFGTSTLYLVPEPKDVATVHSAANGDDVMVIENSTEIGEAVRQHVSQYNPDVVLVANQNEATDRIESQLNANGMANSVNRIGYDDDETKMARLALHENNINSPLVVSDDAALVQEDGTTTVRVEVRNIGFGTAENIEVVLPTQGGEYEFTETQPETATNEEIVWNVNYLQPNETAVIEYQVDNVSGDFQYVPEVSSYRNTAGSSFEGFSFFGGVSSAIESIRGEITGIVGTIGSVSSSLPPLAIGIIAGAGGILGAGVLLLRDVDFFGEGDA